MAASRCRSSLSNRLVASSRTRCFSTSASNIAFCVAIRCFSSLSLSMDLSNPPRGLLQRSGVLAVLLGPARTGAVEGRPDDDELDPRPTPARLPRCFAEASRATSSSLAFRRWRWRKFSRSRCLIFFAESSVSFRNVTSSCSCFARRLSYFSAFSRNFNFSLPPCPRIFSISSVSFATCLSDKSFA